ncbi:uncharacterized protein LOC113300302 isoform X2 [Papaver somniferum]|uniref:uncharacterized protein LOC113300302 isoform X2 n=1 Tax=Papaver somniferum TaxID=3469 RepID=UPI000E705909|nr:uncharacterized protein LOC113300302 isoform X2 [Papaver somniferum]
MKTRKMAAAAAQQQACRYRGNICKILSGDNHLQFCDKHYKFHTDFLRNNPSILKKNQLDLLGSETPDLTKKKKVKKQSSILPPDEERCCRIGGGRWRCKNFRMKSSSGTKNYCEEHCRSISQHNKDRLMKKKKKKSEAGLSKRVTETRDSNRIKRPAKRQLTGQPSTSNPTTSSDRITEGASPNVWTKMKNVESTKGSGEPVNDQLESVELYQSNCIELFMEPEKNELELEKVKAELEKNEVELEKNVRSTKGSGEPVNDQLQSVELYQSNCIELFMEPEKNEVELEKVKAELEKNEVELLKNVESTKGSGEPVNDQLESVELYQSNCIELSMEPEKNKVELEKVKVELEKNEVEHEKNVESTKGSGQPVNDQLESMELYKSNCFELSTEPEKNKVELEKVKAELEKNEVELPKNELEREKNKVELEKNKVDLEKMKKKVECTEFQDKLAEVEETRKSISTDENTTEFWRMECSDAEILVQRLENENSTIGCVETCISNLASLVPGNGKESSLLGCQELSYSEKVESEARGLQNEITQTGEKPRDMSKPNAETRGEGSKDSCAYELKTEEKVLNVEEGKDWGCLEERSSSQADLGMCNKISVNLVSDSNDGGDSLGTEDSLGDSMDMIVPGNGNESLILRCQELSYSDKVESEAQGLQNEITQTGENQGDKDMSKPNAETVGEGSKDSRAYELKSEEKVLNVEEGKGWGCSEERPSQHGSSSQADLEMCNKTSLNLVFDSNDGGDSLGAEDSLGDSMDMIVPGNGNVSSILRCQELSCSEKVESEAPGLQNEITQTGENQRDKDMSKPNAETIGEGSKDSRAYELNTEEKVLNVIEGKGCGCLEERPSEHGSSSQADLEMCKKTSVNLVSDSNDGGDSLGAEDSLGDSMDMIVSGNGNESSEKVESEAQGLQNEITQTGENQRDKDMSKPNAETIGEGSKDSLAYELKTGEKVLNVEEGKGWGPWGCLEERPSQHGSSSQADLEMCKNFLNLVSDSNDGCDSLGAEDSLGDSMDMLAMKNLNMNKDKLTEADMLSSVEDCMKAVGALYQQEISKD